MDIPMTTARAHLMGKCKYCKNFSMVDDMQKDENNKPYHESCKDKNDIETMNMVEKTKG